MTIRARVLFRNAFRARGYMKKNLIVSLFFAFQAMQLSAQAVAEIPWDKVEEAILKYDIAGYVKYLEARGPGGMFGDAIYIAKRTYEANIAKVNAAKAIKLFEAVAKKGALIDNAVAEGGPQPMIYITQTTCETGVIHANQKKIDQWLVKKGAKVLPNVNWQDVYACKGGKNIVKYLVGDLKLDPNKQDASEKNALTFLLFGYGGDGYSAEDLSLAKFLVSKRANVKNKNAKWERPVHNSR